MPSQSKTKQIFGGNNSRSLWKEINAIAKVDEFHPIWAALYSLGCKCQELEAVVTAQAKEIKELKKK